MLKFDKIYPKHVVSLNPTAFVRGNHCNAYCHDAEKVESSGANNCAWAEVSSFKVVAEDFYYGQQYFRCRGAYK
jgi:hypothetical protein